MCLSAGADFDSIRPSDLELLSPNNVTRDRAKVMRLCAKQWLKWFCEAGGGGAPLTKPGWRKPQTHSNPTNLALFRRNIALYRFNQGGGAHTITGGSNGSRGLTPRAPSLEPLHTAVFGGLAVLDVVIRCTDIQCRYIE